MASRIIVTLVSAADVLLNINCDDSRGMRMGCCVVFYSAIIKVWLLLNTQSKSSSITEEPPLLKIKILSGHLSRIPVFHALSENMGVDDEMAEWSDTAHVKRAESGPILNVHCKADLPLPFSRGRPSIMH